MHSNVPSGLSFFQTSQFSVIFPFSGDDESASEPILSASLHDGL